MPEIRELLREAAPTVRAAFDEGGVRRRVARRRRIRTMAVAGAAALAVAAGTIALVPEDPPPSVRAGEDRTTGGVTSWQVPGVEVIGGRAGDLWIGGTTVGDRVVAWVAPLDGETGEVGDRTEVTWPVGSLTVADGLVWVWGGGDGAAPVGHVTAVDAASGDVVGSIELAAYDVEPVGERTVAASAMGEDAIVVLDGSARVAGERVPVGDQPTDLVRTADGALWVRESLDGTIAAVDLGRGEVTERHAWAGGLLAASASGGIWAGGDRLVDLDPRALAVGQSVAQGARLPVRATAVVAVDGGIAVATEHSVQWFADGDDRPVAVVEDEPVVPATFALDGDAVLYVVRDAVRRWSR